ncbi:MAG: hypothetical protein LBF90_06950 [Prevotellaceae bacterium]|nr:hypothetical protein [Prevotellaceae bacterium]
MNNEEGTMELMEFMEGRMPCVAERISRTGNDGRRRGAYFPYGEYAPRRDGGGVMASGRKRFNKKVKKKLFRMKYFSTFATVELKGAYLNVFKFI